MKRKYWPPTAIDETEVKKMLQRQKADIIGEKELFEINIKDCGEPLVPILEYAPRCIIDIKPRRKMYTEETLWARVSVAKALEQLCQETYPLRPIIFDAFRPLEYQEKRFKQRFKEIQTENPSWTDEQIRAETFIYVFPPSLDPRTPPAHSTGGAIDLSLADENRNELDMGYGYTFGSDLMYTNAKGLNETARRNREILIRAMANQGFVSFPGEWWHFSLGDREWAAYLGIAEPVPYGRAENPHKTN